MDDVERQRDQLQRKLQRTNEAFDRERRSIASAWGGKLGPFAVRATISAEAIVVLFIIFNVVCFATGVAFIFLKGTLQTLGISLVVGGLFSVGTFTAQWWDHAWQRMNNTLDRAFDSEYHDKRYAELQRLVKEMEKLHKELAITPRRKIRRTLREQFYNQVNGW